MKSIVVLGLNVGCLATHRGLRERRDLQHYHLQTANLHGNSTDLQYYYVEAEIGTHRQKQSLILDTGSALAAVPCEAFCTSNSCGQHLHSLYDHSQSQKSQLLNCKETLCQCTEHEYCRFYQGYTEGSEYEGYIIKDQFYLGEAFHPFEDDFLYTFGCIKRETNLFYTQKADGILGMARRRDGRNDNMFEPIYEVMYEKGIIQERIFSLCMGMDGGYLQIGGFDATGHQEEHINWMHFKDTSQYRVSVLGMSINDHFMLGSDHYSVGFVDSGTTWTYLPEALFEMVRTHFFTWFCVESSCMGKPVEHLSS